MYKFVYVIVILLFILGVASIFEATYVGLIANELALSRYPWGTEFGWSYYNKTNYMLSGLLYGVLLITPLFIFKKFKEDN